MSSRAAARLLSVALVPLFALQPLPVPAGEVAAEARPCGLPPIPTKVATHNGVPVGVGFCPGIRPGAPYAPDPYSLCTLNFLFRGSDRALYIGSAGHCVLDDGDPTTRTRASEKVWRSGPIARRTSGEAFGRFAYAIFTDRYDFALIRLTRGVRASPRMCYFGGPRGYVSRASGPQLVHHAGNGIGLGSAFGMPVLPGRSALAIDLSSPYAVYAQGVVVPGDSGGPALADNLGALGVVVSVGVHFGDDLLGSGTIGITKLLPQVRRAERKLGVKLRLLNG